MEEKKKENWLFNDRYTKFQRNWIIGLLCLLGFSLIMTTLQGIKVMNRGEQDETASEIPEPEQDPVSSADPEVVLVEEQTETVLQLTADAGREYLDNTLFIGDGNTLRYMYVKAEDGRAYTNLGNTIAVVGADIDAIDTIGCMEFENGTLTMVGAVNVLQPQRIIISLGTNDLGGTSTNTKSFIEKYTAQLKKISGAYVYADLIVTAIPPITDHCTYENLHIAQINAYNRALERMCGENGWKFLNSVEALENISGYADSKLMKEDGLHLNEEGVRAVMTYITTHAWNKADDRPQPLKEIPAIIGAVTNVYPNDRLNGEEYAPEILDPSIEMKTKPEPAPTPTPDPEAAEEGSTEEGSAEEVQEEVKEETGKEG